MSCEERKFFLQLQIFPIDPQPTASRLNTNSDLQCALRYCLKVKSDVQLGLEAFQNTLCE